MDSVVSIQQLKTILMSPDSVRLLSTCGLLLICWPDQVYSSTTLGHSFLLHITRQYGVHLHRLYKLEWPSAAAGVLPEPAICVHLGQRLLYWSRADPRVAQAA